MQLELALLQRFPQFGGHHVPALGGKPHLRLVETIGRAPALLGGIERQIRVPHQHIRVAGMVGRQGDADTAGNMLPDAVEIEGTAQRLEQPLRKTHGPPRLVELQHDGEFVAAKTGDKIALLRQLKQPLRHLAKQRVAGGVSLAVIDFGILQVDRWRVKARLTY
jgi:hypothetical protein